MRPLTIFLVDIFLNISHTYFKLQILRTSSIECRELWFFALLFPCRTDSLILHLTLLLLLYEVCVCVRGNKLRFCGACSTLGAHSRFLRRHRRRISLGWRAHKKVQLSARRKSWETASESHFPLVSNKNTAGILCFSCVAFQEWIFVFEPRSVVKKQLWVAFINRKLPKLKQTRNKIFLIFDK